MDNKQKELFNYYWDAMSEEWRKEIIGFEDFKMENVECSIKVNFKNESWIRVYKKMDGDVEWY